MRWSRGLRRVVELQLLERFTDAEIVVLEPFYDTPEGRSLARKGITFTAAIRPMLEAGVVRKSGTAEILMVSVAEPGWRRRMRS